MFHIAVAERAGADGKENHAVIRYLVDLYGPRLVLTPQQRRLNLFDRPSLYEGKTVLHQAILAHDVKLVQFFVERGAEVHARCIGTFFGATSHAYYGEYPLSFAVCTGQKEVTRYLADNGAFVNADHDVHCCYALHMAVLSDRIASAREGRGGEGEGRRPPRRPGSPDIVCVGGHCVASPFLPNKNELNTSRHAAIHSVQPPRRRAGGRHYPAQYPRRNGGGPGQGPFRFDRQRSSIYGWEMW